MYQALYRKYRPRFFRDVAGQEHITAVLSKQVAEKTFGHAYLFTGSRGIGKTTCAKILAKALNCPNEKDGEPCNECAICKGIDDGSLLDVIEMDVASNGLVDDVRDLREEANYTPAIAKYRVYILDEAHMLSKGAANALLKIMEEPPEHVIFILATTEVNKLPVTVLSRCLRFDFRRMSPDVIAQRVKFVAKQEHISIEDDAALLIGRLADGGMRDALSLLDVCRADENITVDTVSRHAGLAGRDHLFELTDKIIQSNVSGALETVEKLYESSADISRLCDELIEHFRNLCVLTCVGNGGTVLKVLPSELARLETQAKALTQPRIFYCISVLRDTLARMNKTASKRLEFELAMMKMCSPQLSENTEALIARIERLESEITMLKAGRAVSLPVADVALNKAEEAQKAEPAPVKRTAPAVKAQENVQQEEESLFAEWDNVLDVMRKKDMMLFSLLENSKAYLSGSRLLIDTDNETFIPYMQTSEDARERIKNAITEATGKRYGIGPHKRAEKKAENDPLLELQQRVKNSGIELL